MAIVSSIFWVLGLILSVVIAPQLRLWTWGPCLLCFGAAAMFAIPAIVSDRADKISLFALVSGFAVAIWIIVRAYASPVAELAISDGLLVCMAVSTFIVFKTICNQGPAEKILLAGIASILVATLFVIAAQVIDPTFSPIFPQTVEKAPSGFHGHYNYCAAFLIPCSLILATHGLVRPFSWGIRIALFTIGGAGLIALFYTFSRGGVVGGAAGIAVLVLGVILIGYREQKKWFFPLAISSPFVLLGLGIAFFIILGNVQQSRGGGGFEGLMDNSIRLSLLSIAISCIQSHLWFGGGSRSYSWECFQFWDVQAFGNATRKPEHVHNELIQTVSDYGVIGGLLLAIFILGIVTVALASHLQKSPKNDAPRIDAWRIGGFAGFIGLFVQSNFEGIFRIPPGAVLLGLCLAALSIAAKSTVSKTPKFTQLRRYLLGAGIMFFAIGLLFYGYKSAKIFPGLWTAYFSENPGNIETQISEISRAIDQWPLPSLVRKRAVLYTNSSTEAENEKMSEELRELALKDFITATKLHPHDPYNPLNAATLLESKGRNSEANAYFLKGIDLQGGMEMAFFANQRYASFLINSAIKNHDPENPSKSINQSKIAAKHIEDAASQTLVNFNGTEGHLLRVQIYQFLGQAYEEAGEFQNALKQYDYTASLRQGNSSHYLAALLLGKQAIKAWDHQRAPDALRLFIESEKRLSLVRQLPKTISPAISAEYKRYISEKIKYLEAANINPSEDIYLQNDTE